MSKQDKARKKIAVEKAKQSHAEVMASRFYLTIVKHDCQCSTCGKKLSRGDEMVFSKGSSTRSMVILCRFHADEQKILYRPSLRWEEKRGTGRARSQYRPSRARVSESAETRARERKRERNRRRRQRKKQQQQRQREQIMRGGSDDPVLGVSIA